MIILFLTFDTEEEKDKFSEIYRDYAEFMVKVANRILHNIPDAEDVVQEAFLYVADNLEKINLSDRQKTLSYLAIITEHKAFDYIRQRKRRKEDLIESPEKLENALMSNTEWNKDEDLSRAMVSLPAEYREILLLHYYHNCSYKEIAALLDQGYFTITGKMHRAIEKLRQAMENRE